jgi:hypothetical protein
LALLFQEKSKLQIPSGYLKNLVSTFLEFAVVLRMSTHTGRPGCTRTNLAPFPAGGGTNPCEGQLLS